MFPATVPKSQGDPGPSQGLSPEQLALSNKFHRVFSFVFKIHKSFSIP